jgi:hypothetical protein
MVPIFRICIEGVSQGAPGSCDNSNAAQSTTIGLSDREGAMLTAMLGT